MVGQLILDQPVGVRVPAPQPIETPASSSICSWVFAFFTLDFRCQSLSPYHRGVKTCGKTSETNMTAAVELSALLCEATNRNFPAHRAGAGGILSGEFAWNHQTLAGFLTIVLYHWPYTVRGLSTFSPMSYFLMGDQSTRRLPRNSGFHLHGLCGVA